MLYIDGIGMGANWQNFLANSLDTLDKPQPVPPANSSSGTQNPVTVPIPVQSGPNVDPSKPTNEEISAATSLLQSTAAQYSATPPDITVDDDQTKAAQQAIQGAQTQYDQALANEKAKRGVLTMMHHDPETTPADLKQAAADYTTAQQATQKAQRELNVTTAAGYMIVYGQQADADGGGHVDGNTTPPALSAAQTDAAAKAQAFKALIPGAGDNYVPTPQDIQKSSNPYAARAAYDAWQIADAKSAALQGKYGADVANSNLAYTQFQAYAADPEYKDALDAGVGRLNDALAPLGLQITPPPPPDGKQNPTDQVNSAAKLANFADAWSNATGDALSVANAQQAYDANAGLFGPTVTNQAQTAADQSALIHAQTAASVSSSYFNLVAAQNPDLLSNNGNGNGNSNSNASGQAPLTQSQQVQLAHDSFVIAVGNSLALKYSDAANQVDDQIQHENLCIANDPLTGNERALKTVVSALNAADSRLQNSVNDEGAKFVLDNQQGAIAADKKTLATVQAEYDNWNQQHGSANPGLFGLARPQTTDGIPYAPRPPLVPNPFAQQLSDAQAAYQKANDALPAAQTNSAITHQQVLLDQFSASLPDNLLNPQSDSDKAALAQHLADFYKQHHSEMSQGQLDAASGNTFKGATVTFGDTGANALSTDQQRNLIGTGLGLQPDRTPAASDPSNPASIDKTLDYSGDALAAINKVRDEIAKVGGPNAQVSVMPVVYASKDSGMTTTALFKVTGKDGSTNYIDDQGGKYSSISNYVDNNHLSASGTLDIATGYDKNGILQVQQSAAHHNSWLEDIGGGNLNLGMLGAGILLDATGFVLDATGVGIVAGAVLDTVGTDMITTSVTAAALNSANDLGERFAHDQSVSFSDPGARSDYLNLLPVAADGAARGIEVLTNAASKGTNLFTRTADLLHVKPTTLASAINGTAKTGARLTALGGAAEGVNQLIDDMKHGRSIQQDLVSIGENIGMLVMHGGVKLLSRGVLRYTAPYAARNGANELVTAGESNIGVYRGDLSLNRTRATLGGETIDVARDGTLQVNKVPITYDGMNVRVLGPSNSKGFEGKTAFVDQDGRISVFDPTREGSPITQTDEQITFGDKGEVSLSDNLSLGASGKVPLLGTTSSAPAPQTQTAGASQNQNQNSTADNLPTEAAATPVETSASTGQAVEASANQTAARTSEQHTADDVTRTDDTRADQRRSDQRQVQFRRVVDPHSSAGAGGPGEASPVSFKARIAASVLNADEPVPVQRSLIDSTPTGEPPQADPAALPFDSSHSIYVVRAAGMPESAPRTAAVPPRNLSGSPEVEPPAANSKALSGSAANASGPIDLSDHVGELAGYAVQKGAVIKPTSPASFMAPKPSPTRAEQRGPATQAEFNSLEQWRRLSLQMRTANGLLSPANRIGARLTVPAEIRVDHESALQAQGLSHADDVAPNETNLAAHGVSSEPGDAATFEPERHAGTLAAAGAGSRAGLQMPHPDMAEGADATDGPKPGLIERIQMRMGGAPLPNEVSALVQQSGTLSQQLRLLAENGWKVRRGKPGSGSRMDTKRRRVTIDGRVRDPGAATYVLAHETQHAVEAATGTLGLDYSGKRQFTRSALEAEARAQLNAFEARYEISLAGGGDIGEHAGLPESIEREYDNWRAGDRAGLAQRLPAAFAEAAVSIEGGKTYQAFYDEIWASQNALAMPAPDATGARLPATFRERTDWSRENAQEDLPFERSLLSGKHPDHSVPMGPISRHHYGEHHLYVVRGLGTPEGELRVGDGPALSGHGFALGSRYTFAEPYEMREPVILSVPNAELKFAPELANVWQKTIFVAPEGAIGSDGQLRATSGFLRIDPAPYRLRDLGPLTANIDGVFFDGGSHGPVDLAEHLGSLLSFGVQKGGFELGANAVVGVYSQGGTSAADHVQSAMTEFESLDTLRLLGIRTLTMNGVFSVANRVAVLYQPRGEVHSHEVDAVYAHLRSQFTSREVAAGKLPANILSATLDQLDTTRTIVAQEKLAFDFQGIYRDGHFYVSDPNRIEYGAGEYHDATLQKVDEQINAIARGIAEHKILVDGAPLDMPHPAMAETGPYSSKPGLIDRIRMRLFGAPLPDEVSALVSQSSTLSNQLRMLESKGWKVVRGKPGSGSRISTKTKTVTIDGGLRDAGSMTYVLAHEARHAVEAASGTLGLDYGGQGRFTRSALQAEARAQLNAFEARYQISLANGVDIAAHTSLPETIEREYGNWATGDRAALTQRLSEAFAEAPVSVEGGKTYQAFYDEVWARQKPNAPHTPRTQPAPAGYVSVDAQAVDERTVRLTTADGHAVEVRVYGGARGARPTELAEIRMPGQPDNRQPFELLHDPETGAPAIIRRIMGAAESPEPQPTPAVTPENLPSSFDERVAHTLANARAESPFAGGQAPDAASLGRRMGATTLVPGHQLVVLHAEGSPDGRLMLGGRPVPTHDFLLDTRETPRDVDFGWILSARYADVRSAAEMANIWQMPIYAPPTEAVRADGTLVEADAMRRYDPAPYALPDLGRLAVDRQGVHAADDPAKRIDVERYLGAMLGIGSEKAVYELSVDTVVGLYDKAPFTRRANLEAARNEWEGLVMLRQLGLRTVAMHGPFSVANRLAVLYRPRAVLDSFEVIENGTLPKRITQAAIDHLKQIRATVEREKLRLDLQGLFTENGHFYLSDPGKVVAGSDGYRESFDRADRLLKKLLQGLKSGDIELAHPAMTEDLGPGGDYAPRPSLMTRILMRFRGVPVSGDVSALAQHSSLLSEYLRLLSDRGWQVKMGRVGGGSKINERKKQIVIDGGLRRTGSIVYSLAHEVGHAVDAINGTLGLDGSGKEAFVESALEAEARAQTVAFRVRDEIEAAKAIDIAEHVRLPDAIEREAGRARADDPVSLERLAAAFADAPTSLKGNRTYRQHYEAAWAKQRMRWHSADGIEMPAAGTPNPAPAPGGSAHAERAAQWLDARGLRKLQRVEGARASSLAVLAAEAGPGAHVLIAERGARRAGEQPTFIAHTQLDKHGVPGEIHPTAADGKVPPLVKRALSHLDTSNKSVKARGKLDFYISPVPLETLNAFGGAAEIAETGVPETEKLPAAATGVSQQVAKTIGKLANAQHFASAKQAADHAVHATDTIYAVDAKTGVPLGHARKIADAWEYTENAPVAGTRVTSAKLQSAFRAHAGRMPMPWTSRNGVRFVISDQSPETVEAFGGFDPMLSKRAARKAEKPARDPHRSGADLTLLGIYKGRAGLHALARLREAQRAAHRKETAARKTSPVARGIAPNLLPEQDLHAVNFRGADIQHLLEAAKQGRLEEGRHYVYVYENGQDLAHSTTDAQGRLEMRGDQLRWFPDWKNPEPAAQGLPLDASPLGKPPYGEQVQFLLTDLTPAALEAHANAGERVRERHGFSRNKRQFTDLDIARYKPERLKALLTVHAVNFRGINFVHLLRASELGAIEEGKHHIYVYDSEGDIAHMTNNARGRLEMRGKELRWFGDWKNLDANAPGVSIDESPIGRGPHGANMQFLLTELEPKALEVHAKANKGTGLLGARRRTTDIQIRPYQPALSSATVTELIARYGKTKESSLFPQLAALKEYASRQRNASATPVELTDAAVGQAPDVVVADATQWKALHLPLHVARDDSPNGLSQFSPLPTRRAARHLDTATGWQARLLRNYVRAGRRLSVAMASDTKLIRHFLSADPAVQDRVAPMGRAFTLLDNPEQAVERVKRTGGAMPVVTLVVDPNTLNAAQGKKHDPEFVAAVKKLGALNGATVDYENGVIRGANNEVLSLDHLNEKTLFAWLDAAREAGFALRLETAPSRHLVSAHDKAIQAGTNDSYHDYVRTFSLLEDWAKRNTGTRAPQVMVTFHGWDTVLESVPGGGHAKLVEAVLDRPTLDWVHMGLGYGTHGSDSIANEELTTALARLIVKYVGEPEKLARIHGDDALTRVFDRPAASLLVEQQRPLLIELDRVGREHGLSPAEIAGIRERIYQRNTTDFVNQARLAETTYAQRHWDQSGNAAHRPEGGKAQDYARRWMTDVGSHLQNPGNRTLPSAPGKLTPWAQIVSDPALKNDAKKAVSESRETSAQLGQDEIAEDEQALAELTALHLAPVEKNWRTRFLTGATIVGLGGAATVLGTNQFNLFDTLGLANLKTATPHLMTASRIARLFQAAHQASVRSLQNGDPRVFDKVADTLVERLSSQLPNYDRTSKRSAQLQLLADEGKANVARIRWLHKEQGLSYTDAVEQTKIIVGDMLGQMQGAFTGTALKQIHQGNPRHWLGTAARISALAGYTGTLAMDIHALAGNDPWLTVLPTAGVVLSGTYTGMVLLGRRQGVNVDQRSRVARFADSASDAFTASGGLLGASSQLIENHWFAGGTAAASSLILSAGWLNARFPNATPKVSNVPIWLALLPIGIFIGNQIAPFFMTSSNSSGSGHTGPQPPASTSTPNASATPSPGVSASPTTGASASPGPSASPSAAATAGASPSPGQPGQTAQSPQPTPTAQRYLVAEGDSLWVIADHHRKTLLDAAHVSAADQQRMSEGEQDARALQEIFQLNPQLAGGSANLVYAGQQIVIG
ncbi:LWXIA domain-containing protein [Paraburkholderia lacunae]|nr:LWXIA domain-containing protein [Paraburkholderia lacunae]